MTFIRYVFKHLSLPTAACVAVAFSWAGAQATTFGGDLTADNGFMAWVSTDNTALGTPLASGSQWTSTYTFSTSLTPGTQYYLQIEAVNQGMQGGFIGTFRLNNTNFHFANGGQTLETNTTNWSGIYNDTNSSLTQQTWITPTGGVVSYGANGVAPWGTRPSIDLSAEWIWPSDSNSNPGGNACGFCTVDLSTPIDPTPLPAALPLFAGGLGLMGLIGWRRKRKAAAAAA